MAPAGGDMARVAPRMPRLAYRNPLPADQLSPSSTQASSSHTASNRSLADQRLLTPNFAVAPSPPQPNLDTRALSTSLAADSLASNASTSKDARATKKKKKGNGVLGFLTLKEPSQSALDQFAEQQRKQTSEKSGVGSPLALGSLSPQKLPATVPKVNSKWDGIPESARTSKDRDSLQSRGKSAASQNTSKFSSIAFASRSSLRNGSLRSTSSDGSSRNPPNSIVSTASSSTPDLSFGRPPRRDSGLSATSPDRSPSSMSSPSMTSLPEMTYFFPDSPDSPNSSNSSNSSNPSGTLSPISNESGRSRSRSSPSASKPASVHDLKDVDTDAILRRLSKSRPFAIGEAQDLRVPESHSFLVDHVKSLPAEKRSSNNDDDYDYSNFTLMDQEDDNLRSATMNFSRPLSVQSISLASGPSHIRSSTMSSRRTIPGLPTLYEVSVEQSSMTSAYDVNSDPEKSHVPRKSIDAASIAPSVAPSMAPSFTPSVMSESWHQSPRERLGLGGRIRKNDVIPWESHAELPRGKPKRGGRLSLFTRSTT